MRCPKCGRSKGLVVDSRMSTGKALRRRRECHKCGFRWNTYEVKEEDVAELLRLVDDINRLARLKLPKFTRKQLQQGVASDDRASN